MKKGKAVYTLKVFVKGSNEMKQKYECYKDFIDFVIISRFLAIKRNLSTVMISNINGQFV